MQTCKAYTNQQTARKSQQNRALHTACLEHSYNNPVNSHIILSNSIKRARSTVTHMAKAYLVESDEIATFSLKNVQGDFLSLGNCILKNNPTFFRTQRN